MSGSTIPFPETKQKGRRKAAFLLAQTPAKPYTSPYVTSFIHLHFAQGRRTMRIIHAFDNVNRIKKFGETIPGSIYLGGPTPRVPSSVTPSWRFTQALPVLEKLGFNGHVIVPEEQRGGLIKIDNHDALSQWEYGAIGRSSVLVFWYPRQPSNHAEFAAADAQLYQCINKLPERMVCGVPIQGAAIKPLLFSLNNHQDISVLLTGRSDSGITIPVYQTLPETLAEAVKRASA
jgi:hypothetical protein